MAHQNQAIGLRIALTNKWNSKWSIDLKNKLIYKHLVHQDLLIQKFVQQFFAKLHVQILKPVIKRDNNVTHIFLTILHDDKLTESKSENFDSLQLLLENFTSTKIKLYYIFTDNILYDADFLGTYIVNEIENNKKPLSVFKNILKIKDDLNSLNSPVILGIKYEIAGRIKGVDRARTLKFLWGNVSLNTLHQKISFIRKTAFTKEGTLGIKVWITYQ